MNKEEMYQLMNQNPAFHLATMDGDQPRVRGMLLFKADEEGIVFHTGAMKDVFRQLQANPKAEMCFFGNGVQVRVSGTLELVEDQSLVEEIYNHPSREFLRMWKENGIDSKLQVFRMKNGEGIVWSMEQNFGPKEPVAL